MKKEIPYPFGIYGIRFMRCFTAHGIVKKIFHLFRHARVGKKESFLY